MTALIIAVIILSIALIVMLFLILARKPQDYMQSFTLLQQRIGQIEEQVKKSVDEGSKAFGDKFESSLKVIGDIKETLGSLAETNKQMRDIGQNIAELQTLLKPPKIRGSLGEVTLGNILVQLMPRQSYHEQYRFKDGSIVDAVIRIGDKLVPVDSKFPIESFQRYIECREEKDKKPLLREFERGIKAKVEDIAGKYILEDEGTYNFALMYIPSENVYYQTILKEDLQIDGKSIAEFAMEKRIVMVSPNSIYAYLNVICIGLRGMQFEKNVRTIVDDITRLHKEFDKFEQQFRKLGGHLGHAKTTFDSADNQLETFSRKLLLIGESAEVKALEEPEEPSE